MPATADRHQRRGEFRLISSAHDRDVARQPERIRHLSRHVQSHVHDVRVA